MKTNRRDSAAEILTVSILAFALAFPAAGAAQTPVQGPWWPSPHGLGDQAGATNYVTAEKIMQALQIPRTGQTYELGHMYEASMPQYGVRPYYLSTVPAAVPTSAGRWRRTTNVTTR